ncbi:acyl-CoA/acyl-ACP dehydrogenase [Ancylobacter sp. MQZ15Z-1]|uniref:Acyl-CoA/acyl-ACP dehydrogenase n=1 Tax=Ancylobacter mangrovi TaxID=2972472 RepID=A0A9X2P8H0_9HYPH|nr:acyl-CoA dehydrogenase family protein [Ancylobacter mangrovi]MCS0493976.1 acyl-CoA/acyl-ACP dehydrogenase [Ancylobacter mangrovi]
MLDIRAGHACRLSPSLAGDLRPVAARAASLDEDGCFPSEDIEVLAAGALAAAFPGPRGEDGLAIGAPEELMEVLRLVGHASLPLGRLYEGHVNAAGLIARYGTPAQRLAAWRDAQDGALFGIWNTQAPQDGVRLLRRSGRLELAGAKTFASGAGHVARPLITAQDERDEWVLVLPRLDGAPRADLSDWRAHGMRASATGSFRFDGLAVDEGDIIGRAGDYHRQPYFSAGAWRFCAVQLGGMERIVDEARHTLRARGREGDPHQRARMGEAVTAAETARLWVERAARMAEAEDLDTNAEAGAGAVAYVNLARGAVERAGLDIMELVQRSVGLSAFLRPDPLERLCRDLATYLRQPAPDRALCEGAAHVLATGQPLREMWR